MKPGERLGRKRSESIGGALKSEELEADERARSVGMMGHKYGAVDWT